MVYDEVLEQYPEVDPAMVDAVIHAESSGDPNAVSHKGAQGLMQLMEPTAREMASKHGLDGSKLNLADPELNKVLGTTYLGEMQRRYDDPKLALAAYNAGPGNLDEAIQKAGSRDWEAVSQFLPQETQNYVLKVMDRYLQTAPVSDPIPAEALPQDAMPAGAPAQAAPSDEVLAQQGDQALRAMQEQEDAFEIQKQAAVEGAAIGMKRAAEEAAYVQQSAKEQEKIALEQQASELERQERLDTQAKRVEQALMDYETSEIDPRRYWKEKSTGEKLVSAFAIMLSGIGQGMQNAAGVPAENLALKAINRAIDRDIEAQKAEIGIKRDKLSAERGILSDMRSRFGDERQAEIAARTVSLSLAQLKLNELASQYKSPEIANKAKALYGALEQQKQEHKAKLLQLEAVNPVRQLSIRQKVIAGEIPAGVLSKEDRERYVEGLGFAPTAEEAKKVREAKADFEELDSTLEEIKAIREEYGAEFLNRGVVRKQKGLAALALLKIKNLEQLGALDRGAIEIGDRLIPQDPTEVGFVTSQIDALQEQFRKNYRSKVEGRLVERLPAGKAITTFQPAGE